MVGAVKKLPVDPGPSGWNALLPPPDPATPLVGNATADWLVIGAGFAGLAAAQRLSQLCPGDRITVLEARRLADGPAGRNSGFMIDLPHDLASKNYAGGVENDRFQIDDNRHAIAFAGDMVVTYGLPEEAFRKSGKINAAATDKGHQNNLEFKAHLDRLGEPSEMLDAEAMRALTGTTYYQSGVFTPGAAMIQCAMFVRGFAAGLKSNRVNLHEESPVISLDRHGDWVAKTPKGQVTAPRVILAVNGHLESFGHLTGRFVHVFTYASMTRALTPEECARLSGEPVWGITPADPMGTSVRRISGTGGDRLLVRNRFTCAPSLEVSDAKLASVTHDHDHAFAARFPMLKGVEMQYRWGGKLCLSRNNVQVIQELDDGLWSACCQNGLGTVKGTLAGMLAAEAATGQTSERVTRALGTDAPAWLPPAPITRLVANAKIRRAERKAGREL